MDSLGLKGIMARTLIILLEIECKRLIVPSLAPNTA